VAQAQTGADLPPVEKWLRLPATFEENRGQFAGDVRFYSRRGGVETFLTADGFAVRSARLIDPETYDAATRKFVPGPSANARIRGAAVRFRIRGAAPAIVRGTAPLEGKVNYMIGPDPAKWTTNVPTFGSVVYTNILPGVDAVYYESGGSLKYDLVVRPGADLSSIVLDCEGADGLEVDGTGGLVAKTAAGTFRQAAPYSYEIAEPGVRSEVGAKYRIVGAKSIQFDVAARDTTKTLVIDPAVTYATFLGGGGIDAAQGIAVDGTGNAVVTGYTISSNFPLVNGSFDVTANGSYDVFVTKIKPDGSALLYSTFLGGSSADQGTSVVLDNTGAAYVCGSTLSINFPVTSNAHDKTWSFGTQVGDAFVLKLSADGATLVASTFLGGSGDDIALRIGIDSQLNVYVAGWTRSGSLDFPTNNGFQTSFGGSLGNDLGDAFLVRYNSSLAGVVYATYLGGFSGDAASGLAVDATTGKAYLCGIARSSFPTKGLTGSTALKSTLKANGDAFVACIDTTQSGSSSLVFCGFHGGSGIDSALDVAIDGSSNIYVCGYTESGDLPVLAGSFDTTYNSPSTKPGDAWVAKFNSMGTQFGYSTYLGGNQQDVAQAMAVDSNGSAYVCGRTLSANFPKVNGGADGTYNGHIDGFAVKFNPAGTGLFMSTYLGGVNDDVPSGIALRTANDAFLCGTTLSGFIAPGSGFDTSINAQDAFVLRIDLGPVPQICVTPSNPIEVSHTFGDPSGHLVTVVVQNCGSPESSLNYTIAENPAVSWLGQNSNGGTIAFGAAGASMDLTFDATGLPLGSVSTTLVFQNVNDVDDKIEVPVLFVIENGTVTPFNAGDTLSGSIDFEGESDIGSFSAVQGMTLQTGLTVTLGDLKPTIELIDSNDLVVKKFDLKFSTKIQKKTFVIPADGNYRLRVTGQGSTTGLFTCTTKATLPKDAKAFTKKNVGPIVNGLPLDYKIRLLAGAALNVTVQPKATITGPLAISLLDPDNNSIDVTAFVQSFGTGGLQLVNVPISAAGRYTVRVTGLATKSEKATIVVSPIQPAGGAAVSLP
jgi:hypothetical protein